MAKCLTAQHIVNATDRPGWFKSDRIEYLEDPECLSLLAEMLGVTKREDDDYEEDDDDGDTIEDFNRCVAQALEIIMAMPDDEIDWTEYDDGEPLELDIPPRA